MLKVFNQRNDIPPNPKVKDFLKVLFMSVTAVDVGDLKGNISDMELTRTWEDTPIRLECLMI